MKQYTIVERTKDVIVLRTDILNSQACDNFKRYTGKRTSNCLCRPCHEKFVDVSKAKGQKITVMPEGWSPI